jgi:peroxiredoxin
VIIENDGIALFGDVGFQGQVPVHMEFAQKYIPPAQTIELNALNSWIPGGTIGKFIWTLKGSPNDPNPKIITEEHRFVTRVSQGGPTHPIAIPRPLSICLRVEGNHVTGEPTFGVQCAGNLGVLAAPLVGTPEGLHEPLPIAVVGNAGAQPPQAVILGYVNPWSSGPVPIMLSSGTIIRFVDPKSPEKDISTFHEALLAEKVAALVVVVLPQEHRGRIGSIELPANYFLGWTDDRDEAWRRTFMVRRVPATVILNREGKLVWQDTGPIAVPKLKTAIQHNLGVGGILLRQPPPVTLGIGNRAPDFRFEYSKGNEMTLSNLYGRPVVLVFWASWSEPSVEELKYLQNTKEEFGEDTVVLTINDVDKREKAEEIFKKHHLTLPLMIVEHHEIARLFGISCWPTIVSIDAKGRIREIHRGLTEKPQRISKSKASDIQKT